jgi:antitoxin component of MazEF toxin-antitoxin module
MENWVVYRTLRQIGGSLCLSLPPDYVSINKFKPGQRVKVEFSEKTLTITPVETQPKNNP